jgi:hypothetical protein
MMTSDEIARERTSYAGTLQGQEARSGVRTFQRTAYSPTQTGDIGQRTEAGTAQPGMEATGASSDMTMGDMDYRSHWQTSYAAQGGRYEDYEPAYRYGSTLSERYSGRDWSDIEPQVRADWEATHAGSPWEKTKDAIRHGWEKMTGSRSGMMTDDSDYQSHWQTSYATQGGRYEDYAPAYRYGSTLSSNEKYRGHGWTEIEPQVRADWESTHAGSPWEKAKDAVRYGWEKMTR